MHSKYFTPNLFFTSAGGANFAVDTTQYLVGQHSLVVVVYNPLTGITEQFPFTFIGLLEEGNVLTCVSVHSDWGVASVCACL